MLAALVVPLAAGAAVAGPPAGTPDPSAIALSAADFPGNALDLTAFEEPPSGALVTGYVNFLQFEKPYGASRYDVLISEALVETDATAAAGDYARVARYYSSKRAQRELVKGFIKGKIAKSATVTAVKAHALGVLDSSMEVGFVLTQKNRTTNFSVSLLRVDRVLVGDIAIGSSKDVVAADALALAKLAAAHAAAALAPIWVIVPDVAGVPRQGQTLTGSTGTWSGLPSGYAYQWQACTADGLSCSDIAGATGSSYLVRAADVGLTLRVRVQATNRFGSASVSSGVTAPAS